VTNVKGLGFYSAAAQIIPVLLLVLAFELRFFRAKRLALETVVGITVLFLVGAGEATALHVIQTENPTQGTSRIVWATLGVLGVLILSLILWRAKTGQPEDDRRP
jgi:VIT1/CCC1 family predicted Fe2+/Mn2+ transporter